MAAIIVFGANGQLGRALQESGLDAAFYDRDSCDITDSEAVKRVFGDNASAQFVINAAAYTAVDRAETDPDSAELVNVVGSINIAAHSSYYGVAMIQISSDYVFDGTATSPYRPDEPTNPQSVYGNTKLQGESAAQVNSRHYIVRTSWLFGDGNNFVRTMLRLGQERESVSVVADQWGRPTYAKDLAQFCQFLIETKPPFGIYHFSGSGNAITWANFAQNIFSHAGIDCEVVGISTKEYMAANPGVIAPRPAYSVLDCSANASLVECSNKKNFYTRGWWAMLLDYLACEGFIER